MQSRQIPDSHITTACRYTAGLCLNWLAYGPADEELWSTRNLTKGRVVREDGESGKLEDLCQSAPQCYIGPIASR